MYYTLTDLFIQKPENWGLRGDPYLWKDMMEWVRLAIIPDTEEDFEALLERAFEELTDKTIETEEPIFVDRYHFGGLSSGSISPEFWREVAFPLLKARFALYFGFIDS